MSVISNLNEEQKLPVLAVDGAVLVTAGAGSGKTRLLTHRIAYLIEEMKVAPYNILAITFTNKAANEMRERINKLVLSGEQVWVSTFHRLCVQILRQHIDRIDGFNTNFTIYADAERNRVLKDVFKALQIDSEERKRSVDFHLSNAKNSIVSIEEYCASMTNKFNSDIVLKAFNLYQQMLKTSNALDFDDLLVYTYKLLSSNADLLEYYQDKFRYIHVDEFQDTNSIQYDIVRLLAGKWGNVLVVGDEDQCIYGWRGANIGNIINFKRDFPEAKVFKLEQNYRSTKKILEVANKIIDKNTQRLKKTLWTENDEGKSVTYFVADGDREEADFVVRTISDMVSKGAKYSDFAVLMRLNAPSRLFEEYMLNYNLPYKMLGGFRFFERVEIKGIVGYLRAIVNPKDSDSLLRILNYPKRGIGDSTLEAVKDMAVSKNVIDVILNCENYGFTNAVCKKLGGFREMYLDLKQKSTELSLDEFVRYVVDKAGFSEAFDMTNEEDANKMQNIGEFINSVGEFCKDNPNSSLNDYLSSITLMSDIDSVGEDDDYVLISTVHAVKGLEFKTVFVVAMEEGIFPINRHGGERPSDIEEERRLAYVAVTRARENLYLTHSKKRFVYNEMKKQEQSRFLKEMGFEDAKDDFIPYTKPVVEPKTKVTGSISTNVQKLLNTRIENQKKDISSYVKGVQVGHPKFGVGVITDDSNLSKNRVVTIDFGTMGCKTLSLDYAPLQILKRN